MRVRCCWRWSDILNDDCRGKAREDLYLGDRSDTSGELKDLDGQSLSPVHHSILVDRLKGGGVCFRSKVRSICTRGRYDSSTGYGKPAQLRGRQFFLAETDGVGRRSRNRCRHIFQRVREWLAFFNRESRESILQRRFNVRYPYNPKTACLQKRKNEASFICFTRS